MNKNLSESWLYEGRFGFKYRASVRRICAILFAVGIALLVSLTVISRMFETVYVSGGSMRNTLKNGDIVVVERTCEVERGDIVVIDVSVYPDKFSGKLIIKRVIAVGGDELYCENGVVYIKYSYSDDFVALYEDYVSSKTPSFSTVSVGKNEFFFMGDNRADSNDSTEAGCFPISDIYGKVSTFALSIKGFTTFIGNIFYNN